MGLCVRHRALLLIVIYDGLQGATSRFSSHSAAASERPHTTPLSPFSQDNEELLDYEEDAAENVAAAEGGAGEAKKCVAGPCLFGHSLAAAPAFTLVSSPARPHAVFTALPLLLPLAGTSTWAFTAAASATSC